MTLGSPSRRPQSRELTYSVQQYGFRHYYILVEIASASGSTFHWSMGIIRLDEWLRACFPVLIFMLTWTTSDTFDKIINK